MITMRPATVQDSDDLFAWRNDPATCAASRSTAAVLREDHERWMKFNVLLGYPAHLVMIAEANNRSVGVVRFDAERGDVMTVEASITIAPWDRGKHLACPVLTRACDLMRDFAIKAEIRQTNLASQRIFEGSGFCLTSESSGYRQYRREPVR